MGDGMSQKKKRRRKGPFIVKVVCIALLFVGGAMIYSVSKEVMKAFELRQDYSEAKAKLEKVQQENNYLQTEREKLQDPSYVESYARSNYMLSKDGEQIFYLPQIQEDN